MLSHSCFITWKLKTGFVQPHVPATTSVNFVKPNYAHGRAADSQDADTRGKCTINWIRLLVTMVEKELRKNMQKHFGRTPLFDCNIRSIYSLYGRKSKITPALKGKKKNKNLLPTTYPRVRC